MSTERAMRESLVAISRRYSRVAHEVEDLAHDLILSALRRGTPLDTEAFLKSAHGSARRHGAFLARTALRRRAREARALEAYDLTSDVGAAGTAVEGAALSVLSPPLQTTVYLLFMGLDKAELRAALGVTDAALRKRFQTLREHAPLAQPELPIAKRTPALSQLRRGQVTALPRLAAALGSDGHAPRILAASDPDAHGLIFVEALTASPRSATSAASAAPLAPAIDARPHAKGSPCSTIKSRTSPSSS